jgi:hypothetical protein
MNRDGPQIKAERRRGTKETGPNPRIPRIYVALASRRPALSAAADVVRRGDPAGVAAATTQK